MPFTYTVQLPSYGFERSDNKGTISKQEAVEFFRDFPFVEYEKKAEETPNRKSPNATVSFINERGHILWFSGIVDGSFVVDSVNIKLALPNDVNNKEEAIVLIKDFFDGKIAVKENKGLFANFAKLFGK